MINKYGQIEVPVGYTFSDGDDSYRAIRPNSCDVCCFKSTPESYGYSVCIILACLDEERTDGKGVHFIKEGVVR